MTLPKAGKSLEQGIASAKAGNLVLARMHLQQAVALDPDNEVIWLWLAWVAESPASACQCLQKILDVHPNHSIAQLGLEWAEAMQHFSLDNLPDAGSNVLDDSESAKDESTDVLSENGTKLPSPPPIISRQASEEKAVIPPLTPAVSPPPATEESRSEQKTPKQPADQNVPQETESQILKKPDPDETEEPVEHLYQRLERDIYSHTAPPMPPSRVIPPLPQKSEVPPEPAHTEQSAPEPPPKPVQTSQARPTILVVDDSPTVCKLVAMTLNGDRYNIISALDGVEAINLMAEQQPDLILMDINMPRMDGYKLCKLVKKHEATQNIPVVMLSGKDGMFDRLRGRLVGCTDYITKPFDPQTLEETVDRYLGQSASSLP